jgi:FtsP/CotA-like multicopper oxidase with cupredoxin domain
MAPMSKDDRSVLGWLAFAVAVFALFIAAFGLRDDGGGSAGGSGDGGGGATETTVITIELTDGLKFVPNMFEIPPDGAILKLKNTGSALHNLEIPSLGLKSGDVPGGSEVEMRIPATPAGDYDFLCTQPGHASAGMVGVMHVVAGASGGGGTAPPTTHMTWQEMDRVMKAAALAFPAKTSGEFGGQRLEPKILADGTKEFDITTKIVQWEVSPGKFVEAYTYNGTVPGPEIRVGVGDKVRIVLHNEMPESTAIHFHGIRVPNNMDGVPPYTQPYVTPGETFTYEFTTVEPGVGIYHSHHHADVQIPNGLFGAFIVGEMPIPEVLKEKGYTQVDKEVTMVLNDAGTIGLSLNGKSFPATEAYTLRVGQVMMVHYQNEGLMAHPMHMHQPMGWIIAKDGIPLDVPQPADTINVAPGERYTVLYKATDVGVWAWHCHILTHAEGPNGMFGMVTALIVER